MTPELWLRVDDLFAAALRVDPSERASWLTRACDGDDDLLAEIIRLLRNDELAERERFLPPPEATSRPGDRTNTWPLIAFRGHTLEGDPIGRGGETPPGRGHGFTPIAAIHPGVSGSESSVGPSAPARQRLIGMICLYLGLALVMLSWKYLVARDKDLTQAIPYAVLIAACAGVGTYIAGPATPSPARLRAIEAAMIGMTAGVFAVSQYQVMLDFSLRGDSLRAHNVMNHRVLITAILILTYALYASANWRWTALVVGPIALLPFATLSVLYLRHPGPMTWLEGPGSGHGASPLAFLGFDAMLLMILAAGSVAGSHVITRLRRAVREARQVGQYRLQRRIGAGGMGEVYLAEHRFLKRPCALKLIRPGIEPGEKTLARFEREVRLTATLSHPNTVEIYDYGMTEDGVYYYVMEYLPGMNLAELVERYGALSPERVVYLLRQICQALREAHGLGLVHRDIKPSNILISRRGGMDDVAKLLDFGLVRPSMSAGVPNLSDEGKILGTPLYMSPEQAMGHLDLDARSDLYSLGAVAYFLLTGRPPFDEGGMIGTLVALARDPVVPPSQLRVGIPEDLERIVLKCLEKDAAQRFQDAETLEIALGQCHCANHWGPAQASRWWHESVHPAGLATAEDASLHPPAASPGERPSSCSAG